MDDKKMLDETASYTLSYMLAVYAANFAEYPPNRDTEDRILIMIAKIHSSSSSKDTTWTDESLEQAKELLKIWFSDVVSDKEADLRDSEHGEEEHHDA